VSAHASDCAVCRKDLMACTCPMPPAAPELPDGWAWEPDVGGFVRRFGKKTGFCVSVDMLRRLLATQALTIVDAKDRAVLEALERAPEDWLRWWRQTGGGAGPGSWMQSVGEAELARREGKP